MSAVLGLDIGTSNFSGAVWWMNNYYVIANDKSLERFPSFVTYHSRTQQTIGEPAKQRTDELRKTFYNITVILGKLYSDPDIQRIKKGLPYIIDRDGDDKPILKVALPDETLILRPEDVQSLFIHYLKKSAEEHLAQSIDKAVIAVPVNFDDNQRQATIDACNKAGVRVLQLINEPTAAIAGHYYVTKQTIEPGSIIVFDMGFSCTKVTMVAIENIGQFKIQKIFTFNDISGNDFDLSIANYLIKCIRARYNKNFVLSLVKEAHLKYIAEKGKISLSSANETTMEIEDGDRRYRVGLDREKMEQLCSDLLQRLKSRLVEVFRETHTVARKVLMMGGVCKMPMIRNTVFEFFGVEMVEDMYGAVVAVGAAIRAGMLTGQIPGQLHDLLPVDVLPNSLGVSTNDQIMVFVVRKGLKLPCTGHVLLILEHDDIINILEGEGLTSLENRSLSIVVVIGVTPTKPTIVKVIFEVTVYCVVKVTLQILNTDETLHLVVYANEPNMSLNELPVQDAVSPRVES